MLNKYTISTLNNINFMEDTKIEDRIIYDQYELMALMAHNY
jgi:hypothetical protein